MAELKRGRRASRLARDAEKEKNNCNNYKAISQNEKKVKSVAKTTSNVLFRHASLTARKTKTSTTY